MNPSAVAGYNLVFDPINSKLTKYDFGATFEPADRLLVGIKHESTNTQKIELGRSLLLFYHQASLVQTIGSEFTLDHKTNSVAARFGLVHDFHPDL